MLVHSVFFWLKTDVSEQQRECFESQLESLKTVESAQAVYVGTPSTTDRPVVDRSYDYSLTVMFDDMTAHDAYQVAPAHKIFLENCKPMFDKVLIYDAD